MYTNYTNRRLIGNIGYQQKTSFSPADAVYQKPMTSVHSYTLGHDGKVDLVRNSVDGVIVGSGSQYNKYDTPGNYEYADYAPSQVYADALAQFNEGTFAANSNIDGQGMPGRDVPPPFFPKPRRPGLDKRPRFPTHTKPYFPDKRPPKKPNIEKRKQLKETPAPSIQPPIKPETATRFESKKAQDAVKGLHNPLLATAEHQAKKLRKKKQDPAARLRKMMKNKKNKK